MVSRRRVLLGALLAPLAARAQQYPRYARTPIPPPRYERRPPPPYGRHRYRWTRGRWHWNGRRWVWIGGRWAW